MAIQHLLYIPVIFLLGLVFGTMINKKSRGAVPNANESQLFKTSTKRLIQTFMLFLIVFVVTHMFPIPSGSKEVSQLLGNIEIFDKRPVFSSTEVYQRIRLSSEVGISAYKRFTYTIDVVFPVSFFVFLFTYASFVSQRRIISRFRTLVIRLPFFWLASDLIENVVIFIILDALPNQIQFLGNTLGFITVIKFGLLISSISVPSLLILFAKKNTNSN